MSVSFAAEVSRYSSYMGTAVKSLLPSNKVDAALTLAATGIGFGFAGTLGAAGSFATYRMLSNFFTYYRASTALPEVIQVPSETTAAIEEASSQPAAETTIAATEAFPSSAAASTIVTEEPPPAVIVPQVLTQALPHAAPSSDLLQKVKRYEGFWGIIPGYILSCFGYAIGIREQGKSVYLNASSLVSRLCAIESPSVSTDALSSSRKIHQLVLETLNPVLGDEISYEAVSNLFRDFRSSPFLQRLAAAKDSSAAIDAAAEQLEALKNRHLEILPYDNVTLLSKLRPGDILFKKMPEGSQHPVVLGQIVFQPMVWGKKDREAYKYSHVSMYIGNGKIAEAVPSHDGDEVRILDLMDERCALDHATPKKYLVARSRDPHLAQTAAEVAAQIAQVVPPVEAGQQKTNFKYTKLQALRSIWHPSFFGPFARYRYLKQYIDDHKQQPHKDFMDLKNFFCSYFVGACYQIAESRKVMPEILAEGDAPIKGITEFGTAIFRGIWARVKRIQNWDLMSQKIKMQFDAKRFTPRDFRDFVAIHPELFTDLFLLHSR